MSFSGNGDCFFLYRRQRHLWILSVETLPIRLDIPLWDLQSLRLIPALEWVLGIIRSLFPDKFAVPSAIGKMNSSFRGINTSFTLILQRQMSDASNFFQIFQSYYQKISCPKSHRVSITPQMTCFRGASVQKLATGKSDEQFIQPDNKLKLGPSWNWDQKWKIQHWPWLRGNIARCRHQWRHDHYHWLPHWQHEHLSVSALLSCFFSFVSTSSHRAHSQCLKAQVVSLVFVIHLIHMRSWSERLSSNLLSPFTSRTSCRTPSTSSCTWNS